MFHGCFRDFLVHLLPKGISVSDIPGGLRSRVQLTGQSKHVPVIREPPDSRETVFECSR